MTLHEAIELVLNEKQTPMTTSQIAEEINRRNLYQRGDGQPLHASQISARVNKRHRLFVREDGLVSLRNVVGDSNISQIDEEKATDTFNPPNFFLSKSSVFVGEEEDATKLQFLHKKGFEKLSKLGDLLREGLPSERKLKSCGVYSITIPSGYIKNYINASSAKSNRNVINPWSIQNLQDKWVEGVDVVYYGLAGFKSYRPLRERLRDLLNHGNGKVSTNGPHKGGEILWQLVGYNEFTLWFLPTENPPVPREYESELLRSFYEKTGKLPFANRQF